MNYGSTEYPALLIQRSKNIQQIRTTRKKKKKKNAFRLLTVTHKKCQKKFLSSRHGSYDIESYTLLPNRAYIILVNSMDKKFQRISKLLSHKSFVRFRQLQQPRWMVIWSYLVIVCRGCQQMSPHIQSVLRDLFGKYRDSESDQVTQRRIVREVC